MSFSPESLLKITFHEVILFSSKLPAEIYRPFALKLIETEVFSLDFSAVFESRMFVHPAKSTIIAKVANPCKKRLVFIVFSPNI